MKKRKRVIGVEPRYPCPCCGHLTLLEPGSYELCAVCYWEDDPNQLRWPNTAQGANAVSLIEAQRAYAEPGAMSAPFLGLVRPATNTEPLDEGWRPIDLEKDSFEAGEDADWTEDLTALYWWRPTRRS